MIYMHDVGLLGAKSGLEVKTLLEGIRIFEEFKGALTEQIEFDGVPIASPDSFIPRFPGIAVEDHQMRLIRAHPPDIIGGLFKPF